MGHRCRRWGVPAALALTLVLTSCSGDQPKALPSDSTPTGSPAVSSSSGSPTSSPSETATPTPEPPPRQRARNTPAGRKQFARFVIDRWGYALATNDASAVVSLSPRGSVCEGCRELRAELAQRRKQGWFVDFPGAEVRTVRLRPGEAPGVWVADARIAVPASRSYFDDGTFRNDNEAHPKVGFSVRMRYQAGRFVLLSFSID